MKMVRGEAVTVIEVGVPPMARSGSTLGAVVKEATTLVQYPDGEYGYVKPEEVSDGDTPDD